MIIYACVASLRFLFAIIGIGVRLAAESLFGFLRKHCSGSPEYPITNHERNRFGIHHE
jgi:hypothetical protein